MAILGDVKIALRITNDDLDTEITRLIEAAKLDLKRVGIADSAITSCDGLVQQAITTYVLWQMTEDSNLMPKYETAYETQIDGLRKCQSYV